MSHDTHNHAHTDEPVDAWHDHSHDERPQAAHVEKVNAPVIIGVGSALFLLIAATVGVTYMYCKYYISKLEDEAIAGGSELRTKFIVDPTGGVQYTAESERHRIKTLLDADAATVVEPAEGASGGPYIQLPRTSAVDRVLENYSTRR